MKIRPRYGTDPIISYDGDPAAVAAPAIRQRLRLVATLDAFTAAQWDAPSRCAGWTNRDVVSHLTSGSLFWTYSISRARRGTPSQLLEDYDPVATPAGLVAALGKQSSAEVLEAFVKSTSTLVNLLSSLTSNEWTLPGESPFGHVSVSAVVHQALWDAWVHERDIAPGAGLAPAVEPDEVEAALRCAAAVGPAYGLLLGDFHGQQLAATVMTEDPAIGFTIRVDQAVRVTADIAPAVPVAVHGRAVDVLEGLSLRAPLHLEPEWQWLTAGLKQSFEASSPEDFSRV